MYVSLGSEHDWQDWSIMAVKNGLRKLDKDQKIRVIWEIEDGMRRKLSNDELFCIRDMVP